MNTCESRRDFLNEIEIEIGERDQVIHVIEIEIEIEIEIVFVILCVVEHVILIAKACPQTAGLNNHLGS
jgi:hypothetical protein